MIKILRPETHQTVRVGRSRRDVVARFQGANPRRVHQDALQHPGDLALGHHATGRSRRDQEVHERSGSHFGQEGRAHSRGYQTVLHYGRS